MRRRALGDVLSCESGPELTRNSLTWKLMPKMVTGANGSGEVIGKRERVPHLHALGFETVGDFLAQFPGGALFEGGETFGGIRRPPATHLDAVSGSPAAGPDPRSGQGLSRQRDCRASTARLGSRSPSRLPQGRSVCALGDRVDKVSARNSPAGRFRVARAKRPWPATRLASRGPRRPL